MVLIPKKYDKYLQFFIFLLKYRNRQLFKDTETTLKADNADNGWRHSPQEFVSDLKKMGPAFIKFGQFLSTRPDILPENYVKELSNLQESDDPVPFEEIKTTFRENFNEDIETAFSYFNPQPIATASIGQVHEAILLSGEHVAVKIQKPGVQEQIMEDLQMLLTLSKKAENYLQVARDFSIHTIIEELNLLILQELDYRKEAKNLEVLKNNLSSFKHIIIPGIYPDYCSSRVLTMDFIAGKNVLSVSKEDLSEHQRKRLMEELIKAYLKQILLDGFAHADPHPGNIHITKTGNLALLDFGMVVRFDNRLREKIQKLLIEFSENDAEGISNIILGMSNYNHEKVDTKVFQNQIRRILGAAQEGDLGSISIGQNLMEIVKIATRQNIRLPTEFSALGKIMLNMDQIVVFLTPSLNWQPLIKEFMRVLIRKRIQEETRSPHLIGALLESKDLVENLPKRLNKITDDLANHKFKMQITALNEHRFLRVFEKVANRISSALVVAALLVGGAMMAKIQANWTILGYPGLSTLMFLIAAAIGLYLIYQILLKDKTDHF